MNGAQPSKIPPETKTQVKLGIGIKLIIGLVILGAIAAGIVAAVSMNK